MFASLLQEFRFALRSLARTPWFTATSVLMLAAGLGLAMYMFGAINGFVLKPMPFMDSDRLMYVGYEERDDPGDEEEVPLHDFVELRAAQTQFEDLAAFYEGTVNLSEGERPERYDGVFATASLFTELGMKPHLGRLLTAADNQPGAAPVAVISHLMWVNRFAADPGVVGRAVRLNGKPGHIVGVMPPGFRFPAQARDLWTCIAAGPRSGAPRSIRRPCGLELFGRSATESASEASDAAGEAAGATGSRSIAAKFPDASAGGRPRWSNRSSPMATS
jgi:putative ABC transport system permease protein